jgi:hypothetical protein
VNSCFPAVRLGESPDEFLASVALTFTGPDAFELLLKRDTKFPHFESIPNVIGERVQMAGSFIVRETQHRISKNSREADLEKEESRSPVSGRHERS